MKCLAKLILKKIRCIELAVFFFVYFIMRPLLLSSEYSTKQEEKQTTMAKCVFQWCKKKQWDVRNFVGA